jgi:hypothetical protein
MRTTSHAQCAFLCEFQLDTREFSLKSFCVQAAQGGESRVAIHWVVVEDAWDGDVEKLLAAFVFPERDN